MQLEKLLLINEHFQLQYENVQNSFVLLYPEGMVQLNDSAGEILNLCNGKNSCNEIVILLEEKFQTTNLKNDIEAFLNEAIKKGWVIYAN